MKYSEVLLKYNLTEDSLNTLVSCMMDGKSLQESAKIMGEGFTPQTVFAIARWYSETEFQMPVDEFAPQMALERIAMHEERKDEILRIREENRERKRLEAIEEDRLLRIMELKAKAA